MNFDEIKDKAQDFAKEHGDKIGEGLDKAGDFAKDKFGHEDQIDQGINKAKDFLQGGE